MASPEHNPAPPGAHASRFAPRNFLIPLAVLAVCLTLSVAGWRYTDQLTTELASERFEFRATEISHAIEDRVATYEMALRGGLALFTSVGEVSRHQWRDYVGKLNLLQNYPGIQGLGYVKVIPAENIRKHIETVRREGFPEYAIRPPGERPVYTSILYLEPFDARNQRAFGFDMFSEATRRAAMERSRDTGQTTISAHVTLVQETTEGVQAGFLMYLPVYKPGAPIYTGSERRAALRGYVFSPFRMNNFMQGIVGKSIPGLGLEIHDDSSRTEQTLLFRSEDQSASAVSGHRPMFTSIRQMGLFGRTWTLTFRSLSGFEATVDRTVPRLVLFGGMIISLLLSLVFLSLANTRARALALADRMTAELRESEERTRLLLESTGEPIYGIDTRGECTFCNVACLRVLGYASPEDLLGRNMHALIHHTRPDGTAFPVEDCRIFQAFRKGEGTHVDDEVLWRADGTSFPAEYSSYPQLQDGEIVGAVVAFQDITERRRSAALLAAERQRLAYILEGTNVGTWEWNVQTGETVFNERWAQIVGYTLEELAPVSIETWAALAHPEDLKRSTELLERHFSGELSSHDFEGRMKHKNGGWVWVHDRGKVATWTDDGKPLVMCGTHQDITQRKLAEADSAKLAGLVNAASQVVIIATDSEGLITVFNQGAENILGYSAAEMVGRTPEAIHLESEIAEYGRELSEQLSRPVEGFDVFVALAREGGHDVREWTYVHKDGRPIPVELVISPIRDRNGNIIGFLGIGVDISARVQAEAALRKSEANLSAVLETAVDPIFTVGQFGHILSANQAVCRTFGYGMEELVGQNVKMLMPEPFHSQHDGFLERYARTGEAHVIGKGGREVLAQHKDGSIIQFDITVSEFFISGQRQYTGILRDVSERVRARGALEAANAGLVERQSRLDADLEAAAEIQRSLLPKEGTCSLGMEAEYRFMPSATIGGDIFNVICLGAHHTGLYVIDVSGHGVPAALVSVTLAQEMSPSGELLMDKFFDQPRSPEGVLRLLDTAFPLERFDKFFSMFYMLYEMESGTLSYCNAGHPAPMLLRAGGGLELLEEGGTLVGMGMGHTYVQGQVEIQEGDTLLVYTDGVSELESPEGAQFSAERLEELFSQTQGQAPEQVLQTITGRLQAHADGRPPDDDISLVCARFSRI